MQLPAGQAAALEAQAPGRRLDARRGRPSPRERDPPRRPGARHRMRRAGRGRRRGARRPWSSAWCATSALRGLDAGPLVNAIALESLTPVLIHLNRTYKSQGAGIVFTHLPARTRASTGRSARLPHGVRAHRTTMRLRLAGGIHSRTAGKESKTGYPRIHSAGWPPGGEPSRDRPEEMEHATPDLEPSAHHGHGLERRHRRRVGRSRAAPDRSFGATSARPRSLGLRSSQVR